jgi:hypothetical protein
LRRHFQIPKFQWIKVRICNKIQEGNPL